MPASCAVFARCRRGRCRATERWPRPRAGPGAARQVVRILQQVPGLPWHRVVGSGGAIKLCGENAAEQRFRLRMEGVSFRGARVDMKQHEFQFQKARRCAEEVNCSVCH